MNSTERSRAMTDLAPSIIIDTKHGIPRCKTAADRLVEWVWRDTNARVAARFAKDPSAFDRYAESQKAVQPEWSIRNEH